MNDSAAKTEDLPSAEPAPLDHAIAVYSDIACPWAHVLTYRLNRARHDLGLGDEIAVSHRAFPLELIERRPTQKSTIDAEVAVLSGIEPDAGWSDVAPDPWTYSVSTLPALEAVQAAKDQSIELSVALDLALRRAFFTDWACLSNHAVIMDVAATVEGLDVDELWTEMASTGPRSEVWHQFEESMASETIVGSPTMILPDGTVHHNPGFEIHWDGEGADRQLVIDSHDPDAVSQLVEEAVASRVAD